MSRKLIDLDLLQSVFNNYENGMSFESIVEIVDVNLSPEYLRYMYNRYLTNGLYSLIRNSQNNKYSFQFKMNVVQEYLDNDIS
ncbi:hypothetical protein, partial [Staphylococcus sp. CH99b_3]